MRRFTYTVERAVESTEELHNLIRWPIYTDMLIGEMVPRVIGQFPTRLAAVETAVAWSTRNG